MDRPTAEVVAVRGDKADPASRGYICAKAHGLVGLRRDPDRIRMPLRRRDRDFEEIGWEEALDEAASRLKAIRDAHGGPSIGYYLGNPTAHRPALALYVPVLLQAIGTNQIYWVGTIDQAPKMLASMLMFGNPWMVSLPDIDRTDHLLLIGANPVVSNGSVLIAPGIGRRIAGVRARGGKVVVVDPRRSETADIADEHIPIVPGSDALLLMAMVETLFRDGLVRLGRLGDLVRGLAVLRETVAAFSPDRVAAATGVSADTIRRMAREFAAAPSAAIYGRTGTCTQRFGSLANWLIDVLHVLTGNLDRPGGAMFSPGAVLSFNTLPQPGGAPIGRWHSRVRHLPEFMGMLPAAAMADEILTPGEGRVRGFVTQAGNPVLSHPNSARIAEALRSLEFFLSIDIYVNETTRFADIILPSQDYAEISDFPAATSYSMMRKFAKWSAPLLPATAGALSDAQILTELAARLRGIAPAAVEAELVDGLLRASQASGRVECRGLDLDAMRAAIGDRAGPDRIYDIMLRAGPFGDAFGVVPDGLNLDRLRAHPHGLDLGPLTAVLPGMLATPDKLIDLAPVILLDDVARLAKELDAVDRPERMLLIGRRDVRSKNSWMHNVAALAKGKARCTLLLHPQDATRLGLCAGDEARVESDAGAVIAPVGVSDEIMPGVASLPHGWGHGGVDTRQRVAAQRAGVNANIVIDDVTLDVPSATSVLNGVPVRISRVETGTAAALEPAR